MIVSVDISAYEKDAEYKVGKRLGYSVKTNLHPSVLVNVKGHSHCCACTQNCPSFKGDMTDI